VPAARLDGLTETVTELLELVAPDVGVTDSHEPPDAVAVKASPELPAMLTDCDAGAEPPV
jgi:hypothetical protein